MERYERHEIALIEHKADADGSGRFSGYGAAYNIDLVGDKILPGAFAQTIKDKKGKVPILANHDMTQWIGQSISLAEDGKGLLVEGQLFLKTTAGKEAYGLLQDTKDLDVRMGLSIGFTTKDWDWDGETRLLKAINLWELSFTAFPANPKAHVDGVKALTLRDTEKYLRDVEHFSKTDAKRIIRIFSDLNQSSGGRLEDANVDSRQLRALRQLAGGSGV